LPQFTSQHLSPLLLLVNLDPLFADALTKLAMNAGIRMIAVSASVAEARLFSSTANQPPDGLLLNVTETADTALPFLKAARQFAIPAIAIVERSNLSQQLSILRQGGICLPSSVTPQQALTAVIQALRDFEAAKILAIDADLAWLHLLPSLLHPWNLEVHAIDSPTQLWAALETLNPEALLLGELPEISGLELCQLLRSDPTWQHLPVLLLSDSTDSTIQEQAFMAGVDDYLSKPVTAEALANRLINRIRRVRHCR
jgi:DNA-binding response OmpR family regulator